jgi:GH15 family glucan-1,4-alpha-glucosidase
VYKPIENYGLIGNMRSAALVATDGSIDWYCYPHFHSPSIFAAILDDKKGGSFQICPIETPARTQQFYLPETNVLVTRFFGTDGEVEVTDFMPITFVPIARHSAEHTRYWIVRYVVARRGTMKLRVNCRPGFNYARDPHKVAINNNGAAFSSVGLNMELATSVPLKEQDSEYGNGATGEFTLAEGERVAFVFRVSDTPGICSPGLSQDQMKKMLISTVSFWREWLSHCTYRGRWRERVERSALALKLLTFDPTGAIVAAPTTSLPEEIGGQRNWDYRYTWVRDASFCLYAFMRIGFYDESVHFMQWLSEQCRQPGPNGPLRIMYTVDGNTDLEEETMDHLEGYRQSGPVRIGNGAQEQLQLDIYGELMDSAYLHNKYSSPIDYDFWIHLRNIADYMSDAWKEKDCGVWEVRGEPQHYVYTKVLCWVALDRAIRLAQKRSLPADLTKWLRARDDIYEEVMDKGWSRKLGAFTQYYGSETVDASNLLMPLVLFVAPNDPRFLSTLDAINKPLSQGGLAAGGLLYRRDIRMVHDGLPGEEGTFNMCSFWLVEALTRAGRTDKKRLDEARLLFERLLTHSNHLGLYSEQVGTQGEALGNFPQAFTHLALISAAYNLDRELGR